MTTRTLSPADRYPSRIGTERKFIKRGDPVLWGPGRTPLDQVEVEHFHHNGYVVRNDLLDKATVDNALTEVERLLSDPEVDPSHRAASDHGGGTALFAAHETSPFFDGLAANALLADVARQLLDDDVYIHQSLLEVREPLSDRVSPWQADFETWHVEDGIPAMRAIGVSIALTDSHAWTGPMTMITGSHDWYLSYSGSDRRSPDDTELSWLLERGEIEMFTAPAGSVLFYDSNLMVARPGNISPRTSTNVFLTYNSMENTPEEPFDGEGPRPDHMATQDPSPLPRG